MSGGTWGAADEAAFRASARGGASVHTNQARLSENDPKEWGDTYAFLALDAESKVVLSCHVGKRDGESALAFVRRLSWCVDPRGIFQMATGDFKPYIGAIEEYFGASVGYAQLVKIYGKPRGQEGLLCVCVGLGRYPSHRREESRHSPHQH